MVEMGRICSGTTETDIRCNKSRKSNVAYIRTVAVEIEIAIDYSLQQARAEIFRSRALIYKTPTANAVKLLIPDISLRRTGSSFKLYILS